MVTTAQRLAARKRIEDRKAQWANKQVCDNLEALLKEREDNQFDKAVDRVGLVWTA